MFYVIFKSTKQKYIAYLPLMHILFALYIARINIWYTFIDQNILDPEFSPFHIEEGYREIENSIKLLLFDCHPSCRRSLGRVPKTIEGIASPALLTNCLRVNQGACREHKRHWPEGLPGLSQKIRLSEFQRTGGGKKDRIYHKEPV
jgi:hypothetical protein